REPDCPRRSSLPGIPETAWSDRDRLPQRSASSDPPANRTRILSRESKQAMRFYTGWSVCWCPDPLNYPHVIAVTKCASQASTQLRNRATPTSVFINAPPVPVRCGLLFGLPTRRLRDRGTGRRSEEIVAEA